MAWGGRIERHTHTRARAHTHAHVHTWTHTHGKNDGYLEVIHDSNSKQALEARGEAGHGVRVFQDELPPARLPALLHELQGKGRGRPCSHSHMASNAPHNYLRTQMRACTHHTHNTNSHPPPTQPPLPPPTRSLGWMQCNAPFPQPQTRSGLTTLPTRSLAYGCAGGRDLRRDGRAARALQVPPPAQQGAGGPDFPRAPVVDQAAALVKRRKEGVSLRERRGEGWGGVCKARTKHDQTARKGRRGVVVISSWLAPRTFFFSFAPHHITHGRPSPSTRTPNRPKSPHFPPPPTYRLLIHDKNKNKDKKKKGQFQFRPSAHRREDSLIRS